MRFKRWVAESDHSPCFQEAPETSSVTSRQEKDMRRFSRCSPWEWGMQECSRSTRAKENKLGGSIGTEWSGKFERKSVLDSFWIYTSFPLINEYLQGSYDLIENLITKLAPCASSWRCAALSSMSSLPPLHTPDPNTTMRICLLWVCPRRAHRLLSLKFQVSLIILYTSSKQNLVDQESDIYGNALPSYALWLKWKYPWKKKNLCFPRDLRSSKILNKKKSAYLWLILSKRKMANYLFIISF
jgi:hypothetical protein